MSIKPPEVGLMYSCVLAKVIHQNKLFPDTCIMSSLLFLLVCFQWTWNNTEGTIDTKEIKQRFMVWLQQRRLIAQKTHFHPNYIIFTTTQSLTCQQQQHAFTTTHISNTLTHHTLAMKLLLLTAATKYRKSIQNTQHREFPSHFPAAIWQHTVGVYSAVWKKNYLNICTKKSLHAA